MPKAKDRPPVSVARRAKERALAKQRAIDVLALGSEGLTVPQIAARFGVTEGTVARWQTRGIKLVHPRASEAELEQEAVALVARARERREAAMELASTAADGRAQAQALEVAAREDDRLARYLGLERPQKLDIRVDGEIGVRALDADSVAATMMGLSVEALRERRKALFVGVVDATPGGAVALPAPVLAPIDAEIEE